MTRHWLLSQMIKPYERSSYSSSKSVLAIPRCRSMRSTRRSRSATNSLSVRTSRLEATASRSRARSSVVISGEASATSDRSPAVWSVDERLRKAFRRRLPDARRLTSGPMTLALTLLAAKLAVDTLLAMLNASDATKGPVELLDLATFPTPPRVSPRRCRDQEPSVAVTPSRTGCRQ
jgi:hypothetical protein